MQKLLKTRIFFTFDIILIIKQLPSFVILREDSNNRIEVLFIII
jgi:hypothetical protein